ncbi:MAG TPA: hypothetical protein VD994_07220 [Prosthecobacter sp.]|nr:hypothetical protein [Prosthecobacter sp.]
MFNRVADRFLCDAIKMGGLDVVGDQDVPLADELALRLKQLFSTAGQFLQRGHQSVGLQLDR